MFKRTPTITTPPSYLKPFILGLSVAIVIAAASSLQAAWSPPSADPPDGNVDTPINVGTATQVKDGNLSVNNFSAYGNITINRSPARIKFDDPTSGATDYWWYMNNGLMYLLWDKDGDGSLSGEAPWPLQINEGYALFENQVRATEYCDRGGGNCFAPSEVDPLPSQSGQGGKYLKTDGSNASWQPVSGGSTVPLCSAGQVPVSDGTQYQCQDYPTPAGCSGTRPSISSVCGSNNPNAQVICDGRGNWVCTLRYSDN